MRLDADRLNDKKVSGHNEGRFAATKNRMGERKEKSEVRKKIETVGNNSTRVLRNEDKKVRG